MSQGGNWAGQRGASAGKNSERGSFRGPQDEASPGSRRSALVAVLCLVVAFRPEVFFCSLSVIGAEYTGSDQGSSYFVFLGLLSSVPYAVLIARLFKRPRLAISQLLVISLPVFMATAYLLDNALGRTQPESLNHFVLGILFAAPAAVAGMLLVEQDVLKWAGFGSEVLMLLFTAAVLVSALVFASGDILGGVGGASYQTASYLGGLAFNINLHFVLVGRDGLRPRVMVSLPYRVLSLGLIPVQVVGVLLSGGRGGFVLIVLGVFVQGFLAWRSKGVRIVFVAVMAAICSVPVLVWVVPWLLADPERAQVVGRVFAYVGENGIDWSGTSGRDVVYGVVLDRLKEAPFGGFGLFSWGLEYYPHNLFLELMLNGGVVYTFLWVVCLVVVGGRIIVMRVGNVRSLVLVVLGLYPLTLLQFSGSYWHTGSLWFIISCGLCYGASRHDPSDRMSGVASAPRSPGIVQDER